MLPPGDAIERCERVFGVTPKALQLQVAEKIGRGEDCVLIAGCGWGKTLTYFLPLVYWPDKIIIVLTPLKALGIEQQQKLTNVGIPSISLTHETIIHESCLRELDAGRYQAVFLSPELVFDSGRLTQLWGRAGLRERVLAVILDEAHCIDTWGNDFRPAYKRISELRSWLPPGTAFIALTATLTGRALQTIKQSLLFADDVTVINEGNDRSNVKYKVSTLQHRAGSYQDLDFVLDSIKTIVYFQSREESECAGQHLRNIAPKAMRRRIAVYHAIKSEDRKAAVMKGFRDGTYLVMLSTEAAGMGCDINDVIRVVQYRLPSSLSALVQRIGRAARDIELNGVGLLLTPPLKVTSNMTIDDLDLHRYINTSQCRRAVLNEVFNNTPNHIDNCCDNCNPDPLTPVNNSFTAQHRARVRTRVKPYTAMEKLRIEAAIKKWRSDTFTTEYNLRRRAYTLACVLPNEVITKIASKIGYVTSTSSLLAVAQWNPQDEGQQAKELCRMLLKLKAMILTERGGQRKRNNGGVRVILTELPSSVPPSTPNAPPSTPKAPHSAPKAPPSTPKASRFHFVSTESTSVKLQHKLAKRPFRQNTIFRSLTSEDFLNSTT